MKPRSTRKVNTTQPSPYQNTPYIQPPHSEAQNNYPPVNNQYYPPPNYPLSDTSYQNYVPPYQQAYPILQQLPIDKELFFKMLARNEKEFRRCRYQVYQLWLFCLIIVSVGFLFSALWIIFRDGYSIRSAITSSICLIGMLVFCYLELKSMKKKDLKIARIVFHLMLPLCVFAVVTTVWNLEEFFSTDIWIPWCIYTLSYFINLFGANQVVQVLEEREKLHRDRRHLNI